MVLSIDKKNNATNFGNYKMLEKQICACVDICTIVAPEAAGLCVTSKVKGRELHVAD